MPKVGGKREGAGRKPGVPNKLTRPIKELAAEHGPAALAKIVGLMDSQDQRVVMMAAQELLSRAYGKPPQAQEHSGPDGQPIAHAHELRITFVKPGDN